MPASLQKEDRARAARDELAEDDWAVTWGSFVGLLVPTSHKNWSFVRSVAALSSGLSIHLMPVIGSTTVCGK